MTFEGDPSSVATRRVVNRRSLVSLQKRQKAAGIPAVYRSALVTTWDEKKSNPGSLDFVRAYLMAPDCSLYIHGMVGRGKTWCACCIANELLSAGRSVRFQTVSGLLLELRSTFSSEGRSELDVLAPIFDTSYLVLDEIGDIAIEKERRASEFASLRVLTLLDRRWQEGKPTIMTSNLSVADLVKWSGDERIGSRIVGMCRERGIVELVGRDLRCDQGITNQEE